MLCYLNLAKKSEIKKFWIDILELTLFSISNCVLHILIALYRRDIEFNSSAIKVDLFQFCKKFFPQNWNPSTPRADPELLI